MSDVVKWGELTARERDAVIAEKVMGWPSTWDRDWDNPRNGEECLLVDVPRHRYFMPTTDIAAAWEVVEKMRAEWDKEPNADYDEPNAWRFADIGRYGWDSVVVWAHHDGDIVENVGSADTLPEAICIAALRTMGVEVET